MPYFVFHIEKNSRDRVQELTLLDQFENYKQAKNLARSKRAEMQVDQPGDIKIMFADNQEYAEKKLFETREAPILREWEK